MGSYSNRLMYLPCVFAYMPPMRFLRLRLTPLGCHWIYGVLRPCPVPLGRTVEEPSIGLYSILRTGPYNPKLSRILKWHEFYRAAYGTHGPRGHSVSTHCFFDSDHAEKNKSISVYDDISIDITILRKAAPSTFY